MSGIDNFFAKILDDYEIEMEPAYDNSRSLEEFQALHNKAKAETFKSISSTWKQTMGSHEFPKSVRDETDQKLEQLFQQLKAHFCNKISSVEVAEKRQQKVDAFSNYKQAMQTYFEEHPTPSRQELENQHQLCFQKAREMAGESDLETLTNLDHKIEAEYNEYLGHMRKIEAERAEASIAIGIDLGTTNCCLMVIQNSGKPELIRNALQGDSGTTPSYVAFLPDGSETYGAEAKEKAYRYPETTVYDAKRLIGRPWDDENVQKDRECWPFQVVNESGNPKIKTGERTRYPHEISAILLRQLRALADQHFKVPSGTIRKAVITVPAYFTELQRRATEDAARCAGLEVLNILNEPTAAALAYSYERRIQGNRTVLIYDFGGGTFDVSIAKVSDENVEIIGVDGDTHLGGQDIDNLLMNYCVEEFKAKENYDLNAARKSDQKPVRDEALRALSRIKLRCEKVKEQLATTQSVEVYVEGLVGNKDLIVNITREKLNNLCEPLVSKTLGIVSKAIDDAQAKGISSKDDIDDIILVGGSTRLQLVEKMLTEYFTGKRLCKSINPDEAVAYGAAAQAFQKTGRGVNHIAVQDVLPISIGIEVIGGKFSRILDRNSQIPSRFTKRYVTASDMQTRFLVKVFQGESSFTNDNKLIGEFLLEGIPPKPAGEESHETTMVINSVGMLHVESESNSTGTKNEINITADRLGMDQVTLDRLTKKLENLPLAKPKRVKFEAK